MFNRLNAGRALALLIAVCFALAATGCGDDDNDKKPVQYQDPQHQAEEEANFSEEPPPVQILAGFTSGYYVDQPTVEIVRTEAEMKALKKKHFDHGVRKETVAPTTWGERQVVGAFLPQDKPGALLTVTDVFEQGDKIVVKAVKLLPGKGCGYAEEKPRPFHMVETRNMKGEPDLQIKTQRASACK